MVGDVGVMANSRKTRRDREGSEGFQGRQDEENEGDDPIRCSTSILECSYS